MALPPFRRHPLPPGHGTVASCCICVVCRRAVLDCGILLKTNDLPRAFGRGVGWVSAGWPGSGMDVSESKPGTVYAFGSKVLRRKRAWDGTIAGSVWPGASSQQRMEAKRVHACQKEKGPAVWLSLFCSYPLLSEYQVQPKNRPKFFEGIRMEAVWNQREHFRTVREKLDNFSTFGGKRGNPRDG
jgi:hypothetical protein